MNDVVLTECGRTDKRMIFENTILNAMTKKRLI